jgi:large repetitive protein
VSNTVGGTTGAGRNVIGGSAYQGLVLRDAGTKFNTVQGNYIGLNSAGSGALSNAWARVAVFGGARNVISGNGEQGVTISDPTTGGNIVAGNYIGVDPTGTVPLPNGWSGVEIFDGGEGNLIASNLISGNLNHGVLIDGVGAANNVVWGNFIGVDASGTTAIPNGWAGVCLYSGAQSDFIGGTVPSARNLISGNGNQGVALLFAGVDANRIQGNFIGLDASGMMAIPNGWSGVDIYSGPSGNVVGGPGGARNFISGNGNYGILIDYGSQQNRVVGNTIGLNAANNATVPNAFAGIQLFAGAVSNQIGGLSFGDANLISGNSSDGVQLADAATSNNVVRGNSIVGNAGAGIGLYSGANHSAIAPSLTGAALGTNTVVRGTLTSLASTTFQIDYYANPAPAAGAEGMTYLGARSVTTSAGGTATFTNGLGALIPAGRVITATATDPDGNTSAFSGGVTVTTVSTVNDGIPDAWRAAYFGGTGMTTNSSSCATCDADGDGLNNQSELYAGTNPTNAASTLKLTALNPIGSGNVVSLPSISGISYRIESRDDIATAPWSLFADQLLGTGSPVLITDTNALAIPRRFYRAGVLW